MLQDTDGAEDLYSLPDEALADRCKADDKAAYVLILRYAASIRAKAGVMSNNVLEADDLMQEGLLGLLNAIRTFDPQKGTPFSAYSNVCITNKMKTALFKSNRSAIPVDEADEQLIPADLSDPESILLEKEKSLELDHEIRALLSENEWQIFRLFLQGSTYFQMARQLNISPKTVDNALQRVRRKLKSVWKADHFST